MRGRESSVACASRELHEETGIAATKLRFVCLLADEAILMAVYTCVLSAAEEAKHGLTPCAALQEIAESLAPNVMQAVKRASHLVHSERLFDCIASCATARDRARTGILNAQVQVDAEHGWDHLLGNRRVGIIGTALGVRSALLAGAALDGVEVQAAARTLLAKRNKDGGWGMKGMAAIGSPSVTESTAYVMLALSQIGSSEAQLACEWGVHWLLENRHETGGWGMNSESLAPRVLPTCLALEAILAVDRSQVPESSVQALFAARSKAGLWGPYLQHTNTVDSVTYAHTSRAVSCLVACGHNMSATDNNPVAAFLSGFVANSGTVLLSETDSLSPSSGGARMEFKHFVPPLVLRALIAMPRDVHVSTISALSSWLLEQQETATGLWRDPVSSNKRPVWALSEALSSLCALERYLAFAAPEQTHRLREFAVYESDCEKVLAAARSFEIHPPRVNPLAGVAASRPPHGDIASAPRPDSVVASETLEGFYMKPLATLPRRWQWVIGVGAFILAALFALWSSLPDAMKQALLSAPKDSSAAVAPSKVPHP